MATRRERKDAARLLLERFEPGAVDRWARSEPDAWGIVQRLLFDDDALVRWRAVEAAGRIAAARGRPDPEGARDMVRRALWLMNDESGGCLWLAPEVLGAALASVPALRPEFLQVLASFLEEEPFREGTRWALWRVALAAPAEVAAAAAPALAASLADPDPAVRGHAALALAAAAGPAAAAALAGDPAPLVVFDPRTGTLRATTVGEAAAGAF
ncbi:MAG TPA: hypothetical protein VFL83_01360 [Anaeromyxobacter sp.]|nr:hypothetical protein [Anaeromyxobacter sp.]